MIQRIQTLWMVLTAGLVVCAALVGSGLILNLWFVILLGLTALVPLVAIFIYKNRSRQTSMLIAEFVLLFGSAGFTVYYAWFAHTVWAYAPVFIFAAFITNWLALRGVLRDEMLVKAADRIR